MNPKSANPFRWSQARAILVGAVAVALALTASGCEVSDGGPSATTGADTATIGVDKVQSIADLLPETYKGSGTITVGATTGLAPMMYIGDDGKTITGVEADLLHAVGQVLGVKVNLQDVKPEAFMTGILAGRFDLAAGSITYTAQRATQADFVVYAKYGQSLATLSNKKAGVTFDSLCGLKVAVLNGSVQQTTFLPKLSQGCTTAGKPAAIASVFPDANSLFLSVQSGRADAAFLNEVSILYYVKQSDGSMSVADTGLGSDPKGIVVGKNTGLQKPVEEAVQYLADHGQLKQIFTKWGLDNVLTGNVQLNPAIKP